LYLLYQQFSGLIANLRKIKIKRSSREYLNCVLDFVCVTLAHSLLFEIWLVT